MQSKMLRRLAAAAVLVLAAGVSVVTTAAARPARPGPLARRSAFNLFAGATNVMINVNRVQCNVGNFGNQCVDPNGSPVVGGGFWPKGSPDQYIFNGGLQIGAIVCYDPGCSTAGPWKGDTVGVFFMDPRGTQIQGSPLTNVFNSLNADDAANWPTDAYVSDTSLYSASLIGRAAISQQDTWVRYWDGNTSLVSGRKHAMGVLVEQRGVAWNFPSGNEDIIYFLFRFINVTSGTRSDYDQLLPAGYTPAQVDAIFGIAQDFRTRAQSAYNVALPVGGFTFHKTFVNYFQDADEGDAGFNFSVATLPFAQTNVYKSDFHEANWAYPPNIFGAPFAAVPGFEGVKYLRSPINPATGRQFGITIWSNTCNGCGVLDDARGVSQMYRYISGTPSPALGDAACSVPNPLAYHTCGVIPTPSDTRFFMASGPFELKPGQSSVVVVAMVHAAPVASLPASGSGIYALPAFSLTPYITPGVGTLTPGIPATAETLAVVGGSKVRPIERAEGWAAFSDVNGNGTIEQNEVTTVPRSLLDKDKVAQAVFDNKFLLPFAPDPPSFFLVPGDGQVTVAWQKSASETIGDPYFAVASAPLINLTPNPLYDPNYRKFDVEGYRIWRGRTQSGIRVIAQFDYTGTVFNDYTGAVVTSSFGNQCAPELGVTASCPVAFQFPYAGSSVNDPVPIVGDVVQIPAGGRTLLASGNVLIVQADTAVTGGGGTEVRALTDNGVPFVFVDNSVRDGFTYYYAVTAFDVNSRFSGPSSLQSPLVTKAVIPRVGSGAETPGTAALTFTGRSTVLDPTAPLPAINATTGIFSGPQPPTNGITIGFAAFLPYINSGSVAIQIDSVVPSYDCSIFGGACANGTYFVTVVRPDSTVKRQFPFVVEGTTGPSNPVVYRFPPIRFLNSLVGRFGGDSTYTLSAQATLTWPGAWDLTGQGRGAANNLPAGASGSNGPRWWAGSANETLANPNGNVCAGLSSGGCVDTVGNANASAGGISGGHINGVLPGIQYLWSPAAYMTATNPIRNMEVLTSSVARAADFKVYWGATAGKVDSVIDVTHNVVVPFSPRIRASWGILNDSSFTNTPVASTLDQNNSFLTFTDMMCVDPVPAMLGQCGSLPQATAAFLMDHAISNPMNYKAASTSGAGGAALVAQGATGNGFIFYLNGKFFVMQMTSTLAACCQNTVWNGRFYAGIITGSVGSFGFVPSTRPSAVPGLKVAINFTGSSFNTAVSNDTLMSRIHTVPDPYYVTNSLEITANTKVLRFVNLPAKAIIRIYSASGILVNVLAHNDARGGGEQVWNLRNRNNQFVASGVYFYHVEAPDGKTKIGRFTVVNFAQ